MMPNVGGNKSQGRPKIDPSSHRMIDESDTVIAGSDGSQERDKTQAVSSPQVHHGFERQWLSRENP
jgi:hypothetical protein